MKNPLARLLRFAGLSGNRKDHSLEFPADLKSPGNIMVYSGPLESAVWPAILLANALQTTYKDVSMTVICPLRDGKLFKMLRRKPEILCYDNRPKVPKELSKRESRPVSSLLFFPYSRIGKEEERFLRRIPCKIRIAPLEAPSPLVNIRVRTRTVELPGMLEEMCGALRLAFDSAWKPVLPRNIALDADHLVRRDAGRGVPYMVVSPRVPALLKKLGAEIPLRKVVLGKKGTYGTVERELAVALVAGSEAVVTDDATLWSDACALGRPVVGLDSKNTFMKWRWAAPVENMEEFAKQCRELAARKW